MVRNQDMAYELNSVGVLRQFRLPVLMIPGCTAERCAACQGIREVVALHSGRRSGAFTTQPNSAPSDGAMPSAHARC
jgi:hypothetical protein